MVDFKRYLCDCVYCSPRQGHLTMVVLLLRYGGNPELLDAEGKPCHAANVTLRLLSDVKSINAQILYMYVPITPNHTESHPPWFSRQAFSLFSLLTLFPFPPLLPFPPLPSFLPSPPRYELPPHRCTIGFHKSCCLLHLANLPGEGAACEGREGTMFHIAPNETPSCHFHCLVFSCFLFNLIWSLVKSIRPVSSSP